MKPEERMAVLLKRMEKKHGPTITMEVDWRTLICLIAHVQLALRHPENKTVAARAAREWKEHLFRLISLHDAELVQLLRLGDAE